ARAGNESATALSPDQAIRSPAAEIYPSLSCDTVVTSPSQDSGSQGVFHAISIVQGGDRDGRPRAGLLRVRRGARGHRRGPRRQAARSGRELPGAALKQGVQAV